MVTGCGTYGQGGLALLVECVTFTAIGFSIRQLDVLEGMGGSHGEDGKSHEDEEVEEQLHGKGEKLEGSSWDRCLGCGSYDLDGLA